MSNRLQLEEVSLDALELAAGGAAEGAAAPTGGFSLVGMFKDLLTTNKQARTQKECAVIAGEYQCKAAKISGQYSVQAAVSGAATSGMFSLMGQLFNKA